MSATVTSQATHFPVCQGMRVTPSGLLLSLNVPIGSFVAWILALENDRQTTSFNKLCLVCLPVLIMSGLLAGAFSANKTMESKGVDKGPTWTCANVAYFEMFNFKPNRSPFNFINSKSSRTVLTFPPRVTSFKYPIISSLHSRSRIG